MSSGTWQTGAEHDPDDKGTPGPAEHNMTKTAWGILAFAVGVVLIFAGTAYAVYSYQSHSHTSDQRWCQVLTLLTSKTELPPADPAANPSRVAQYQLYEDFMTLSREFGCD